MNILIWLVLVLMACKLVWNLGVPYRLLNGLRLHKKGEPKRGISLSLEVEIILLLIATVLAWLSNGDVWINSPGKIFAFGLVAILISYLHFFIVGMIGGWLITRNRSPASNFPIQRGKSRRKG